MTAKPHQVSALLNVKFSPGVHCISNLIRIIGNSRGVWKN